MKLMVNGEKREVNARTLEELIDELDLRHRPVATMHNGKVVRRADRPQIRLAENDSVEIISMVGGG